MITMWNMSHLGAKNWLILSAVDLLLLVSLWKYFNKKGIVEVTLSTFFLNPLPKRERIFLLTCDADLENHSSFNRGYSDFGHRLYFGDLPDL
ncbi:hypothetical protein OfM2_16800 [Lactovum odontotermitis]